MTTPATIAREAAKAHPAPSDAQKRVGNYPKGHVKLHGLDISIENAKGSMRRGTGADGKAWSVRMPAHYGYVRGTEGADGDHHDVYLGPTPASKKVFVVDQVDAEKQTFDEHKSLLGFVSQSHALDHYHRGFSDGRGPKRVGGVTHMSIDEWRDWIKKPKSKKPLTKFVQSFAEGGPVGDDTPSFDDMPDHETTGSTDKPLMFDSLPSFDDMPHQDEDKPNLSPAKSFAISAAHAAPAAVGAVPFIAGGAKLGAAAGAIPFFSVPTAGLSIPVGAFLGGAAGGFAGGAAISWLQEKLEESLGLAPTINKYTEAARNDNPISAFAGELAPNLLSFRPDRAATLAMRGVSGGGMGALEAAQEAVNEGTIDPMKVGMATAFGAAAPGTTKLGGRLMAAGEQQAKPLADAIKRTFPGRPDMSAPNADAAKDDASSSPPPRTTLGTSEVQPAPIENQPTIGNPASAPVRDKGNKGGYAKVRNSAEGATLSVGQNDPAVEAALNEAFGVQTRDHGVDLVPPGGSDPTPHAANVAAHQSVDNAPNNPTKVEPWSLPSSEQNSEHPHVPGLKIVRGQQLDGLSSMPDPDTVHISERVPNGIDVDGKTLDPAYPLALREAATAAGVSRLEQEQSQTPLFRMNPEQMRMLAEKQMGEPAEKAWLEAHGYDYGKYREIIDGLAPREDAVPVHAGAEPVEPNEQPVEQRAEAPAVEPEAAPQEQRAPAPVEPADPVGPDGGAHPRPAPAPGELEPRIPDFLRRPEPEQAPAPKPVTAAVTAPQPNKAHGRTRPLVSLTGEPVAEPEAPKQQRPNVVARVIEQLRAQGMDEAATRIEGLPNEQATAAAIKARSMLRERVVPTVEGAKVTAPSAGEAKAKSNALARADDVFNAAKPPEGETPEQLRQRLQSAVDDFNESKPDVGSVRIALEKQFAAPEGETAGDKLKREALIARKLKAATDYNPRDKSPAMSWLREAQVMLRRKDWTNPQIQEFVAKELQLRSGNPEDTRNVNQDRRIEADIAKRRRPRAEDVGVTQPIEPEAEPVVAAEKQPFPRNPVEPEDVESTTPAQEVPQWKLQQMAEEAQRRARMQAQREAREKIGKPLERADNAMTDEEVNQPILRPATLTEFMKDEKGTINLGSLRKMLTRVSGLYGSTAPFSKPSYIARTAKTPAEQLNRDRANELHVIDKAQTTDKLEHMNTVEHAPEADRAALADPKVEEEMYLAHEAGNTGTMSARAKDIYDRYAKPILDDNAATYARIKAALSKAKDVDQVTQDLIDQLDPDHVHRVAKGHNAPTDPQGVSADPVEGLNRSLNTTTGSLRNRKFFALEGNGHRIVVSGTDDGFNIWQNGRETPVKAADFELKPGEQISVGGHDFEVVQARTPEIEQHARFASGEMAAYEKNLMFSAADTNVKLRAVERNLNYIESLKKDPAMQPYMVKLDSQGARNLANKNGWQQSKMPQFEGWAMDDQLRYAFDDYARPGLGQGDALNMIRRVSQAVTKTMFWMPTPHMANVAVHWWVGRGWDWIKPTEYQHLARELSESYFSVMRQDDFQKVLRAHGAGQIYDGVLTQDFARNFAKAVGMDIARRPALWEPIAEKLGLGRGARALTDLTRRQYAWSARTMWSFNDTLLTHAVKVNMRKGMNVDEAITHAERDIPNYRIPSTIMGGGKGARAIQQVLAEPGVVAFGRYHEGVYNSIAHIAKGLAFGNTEEKIDAAGKVFALGLFTFAVKPAFDAVAQFISSNEDAEVHPRGPLTPLNNAYEYSQGRKDTAALAKSAVTLSPLVSTILEAYDNKDFAGRTIAEPGQSLGTQALRHTEHAAKGLVSPYGTIAGAMGRDQSPIAGVRDAALDIKNPSERSARYQATIEQKNFQKANQANKHPLGPIEKLFDEM